MSRSLGIPVKLLHEACGHVVTVELKSGELYRGSMVECEDNWNCQLESITFTAKDGKVSQLEHVFIRGSKVRFMVIPDMLKNAPMFKRLESRIKGKGSSVGVGRGRAVAMRARAQAAGRGAPPGRGVPPSIRRFLYKKDMGCDKYRFWEETIRIGYVSRIELTGNEEVTGNLQMNVDVCRVAKSCSSVVVVVVVGSCRTMLQFTQCFCEFVDQVGGYCWLRALRWGRAKGIRKVEICTYSTIADVMLQKVIRDFMS
ncbi:hypothetical protein RHMOL_Rhmol06G0015800 [Rhododendron molle]|uniref:Uncharacterized protein n=1 Tax=Rhododendron molle TaxID=49168 RepID=A0ACC0N7S7_RHOML|nr:hypothetical protein RHMOL_Rhmol06G0015800 [Rhododendron molle]